jgi:acetyl-CoA C-acetyltransferase
MNSKTDVKTEQSYVSVAGVGITKFGELWGQDLRDLAVAATKDALLDSGLHLEQIEAIFVANMNGGLFTGQEHIGALVAAELGVDVPAWHIEAACASGAAAVLLARESVLSGKYRNVLVVGAEKMTDVDAALVTTGLAAAADEEWEAYAGATFPALYAMIAREYFRKYAKASNPSREDLALISVKNHRHGSLNPKAHFPREIAVDDVLNAPMVAEPLGLLDCSPVSDGAAAVILSADNVRAGSRIIACEQASSSLALHDRAEITELDATVKAAAKAYSHSGLTPKDIGLVELHDCFSIAELLAYEDLGFARKGHGAELIREGVVNREGRLPVNTSGGLKASGHPVGATGIKQIIELHLQLTGRAGERQLLKVPSYGLAHNVGGSGATAVVSIMKAN